MAGSTVTIRTRRAVVFLAIVIITLGVAWFVMRVPPSEDVDASGGRNGARGVVQAYPVGDRADVAPFEVAMLDGSRLSDTDLRGTVTVLNVWGSWCGPCRAEAPELVKAVDRLDQDAQFYGINVRDSLDAAREFERAFEIPYPSVRPGDSAAVLLAFGEVLTALAVPITVVDDPTLIDLVDGASTPGS